MDGQVADPVDTSVEDAEMLAFIEDTSKEPQDDDADEALVDPEVKPEDEEEKEEDPAPQTSLTKVLIKDEDGLDKEIEVEQKELVAGYQRHADYTRKVQGLANREREATQVIAQKLQEGQSYYLQQAQAAQAAVVQLAGLRSDEEMAALAQSDPAQWVAEQQRQTAVRGVLSQLQQNVQYEQQRAQEEQQRLQAEQKQTAYQTAWDTLNRAGVTRDEVATVYKKAISEYGVSESALAELYDPKAVMILRDAVKYRELLGKKQAVTKQAQEAPKLPQSRPNTAQRTQVNKTLEARFSTGKAKLNDLVAWANANNI